MQVANLTHSIVGYKVAEAALDSTSYANMLDYDRLPISFK